MTLSSRLESLGSQLDSTSFDTLHPTMTRTSLKAFLGKAKGALAAALKDASHQTPVTFVLGNESADLDSLCSAVTLAYFRTYRASGNGASPSSIYIPLSNLQCQDLALRPELTPVLKPANLSLTDLITLSDLPPQSQISELLPPSSTKWLLVDHNAITGDLGKTYSKSLIGVIDHHDEEHVVPEACPGQPRIVEKSGSCASLVVRYCRSAWEELAQSQDPEDKKIAAELAHVALGPVLIDTTNLTSQAKVTPADIDAATFLEKTITSAPAPFNTFNRDTFHNEIAEAKSDLSQMSLRDILRKDYKEWTATAPEGHTLRLGISSVVRNLDFLLDKAGSEEVFLREFRSFAEDRGLDIACVMTAFTRRASGSQDDGKFARELVVAAWNGGDAQAAAERFQDEAWEELRLETWRNEKLDETAEGSWRRCWVQGNVDCSRKQVAPLLRKAMF